MGIASKRLLRIFGFEIEYAPKAYGFNSRLIFSYHKLAPLKGTDRKYMATVWCKVIYI